MTSCPAQSGKPADWKLKLVRSDDGEHFTLVTHLDVDDQQTSYAGDVLSELLVG